MSKVFNFAKFSRGRVIEVSSNQDWGLLKDSKTREVIFFHIGKRGEIRRNLETSDEPRIFLENTWKEGSVPSLNTEIWYKVRQRPVKNRSYRSALVWISKDMLVEGVHMQGDMTVRQS